MIFKNVMGHIEVYAGELFLFSADNMCEAHRMLDEMEEDFN